MPPSDVAVSMYHYDRPAWTGLQYETECYFPTWINREDAPHLREARFFGETTGPPARCGRDCPVLLALMLLPISVGARTVRPFYRLLPAINPHASGINRRASHQILLPCNFIRRMSLALRPRPKPHAGNPTPCRWPGSLSKESCFSEANPTMKTEGPGSSGGDSTTIGPEQALGKRVKQVVA